MVSGIISQDDMGCLYSMKRIWMLKRQSPQLSGKSTLWNVYSQAMEDKDPITTGENSLSSAKILTPENSLGGELAVEELLTLKKK